MNTSVLGFLNFLTWAHKEKIVNDKIPDTKEYEKRLFIHKLLQIAG